MQNYEEYIHINITGEKDVGSAEVENIKHNCKSVSRNVIMAN